MERQLSTPVAAAGAAVTIAIFAVSMFFACAGGGCAVVADPPLEVAPDDFPLALLLLDTELQGTPGASGLELELCSAQLTLRNDAPVPVGGVGVVDVTVLRAGDGEPLLSLAGAGESPGEIEAGSQVLVPLEAVAGALAASCGEDLVLEVSVAANGVVTTVRGHAVAVACP